MVRYGYKRAINNVSLKHKKIKMLEAESLAGSLDLKFWATLDSDITWR